MDEAAGVLDEWGTMSETVNHPQHYGGDTPYETIKVLKEWLTAEEFRGFLRGNTIKYLSRAGKKGHALEDLKKALWYLAKEIENTDPCPF